MKRNDGFSLVELMIASAIVVGMALMLAATFRESQRSWQSRENTMTVSFELRRGVQSMTRELSESSGQWMQVPGVGTFPADGNTYNSIQFRVPEDINGDGAVVDGAGNIEWSAPITYSLGGNNGQQILRTQGGNVRVLAHGVTVLRFRRLPATPLVFEMNVTVQRGATPGGFLQQSALGTRIRLRN